MENCIFCKIVKGELPCHKVYEDDKVLAFLDVAPVNPGHTLVVSKEHYANLEEIPEESLSELIKIVKMIGSSIKENLGYAGYNLIENNDPIAGQIIPHIHFHLIPRRVKDGLELWPQKRYQEGEAENVAKRLRGGK